MTGTNTQDIPRRLADGNLLVPVRLEWEDGTIGDGTAVIGPDNPEFQKWADWMRRSDAARGTRRPGRAAQKKASK